MLPRFPKSTGIKKNKINVNKATSPDGVEERILKECWRKLTPHLTMIFRKSLDSTDVPMQWREAEIPLIHKGGSKELMPNY